MPKLFFSDIDGTLLRSDGTISTNLRNAFAEMAAQGHGLILTSGRPLASIRGISEMLGTKFPYSYIIANNGCQIYDCNQKKTIYEKRLGLELVDRAQKLADEMHIHLQTYNENAIICEKEDAEILTYTQKIKIPILYTSSYTTALEKPPYKMLAIHLDNPKALDTYRKAVEHELGTDVQTMLSNPRYLEIIHAKASKGNALRFLCNYLNVPICDTLAAGDSENDISLFQAAGTGYAMANSDDNVKSSAAHVTALDNDHDGILEIIQKHILV